MDEVRSIHEWLKSSYDIRVKDEWLSTCIEFIRQETEDTLHTLENLKHLVFEQWLVSDLSEIGEASIPDEVFTDNKCYLRQLYPLQMVSMVDVASPLYGQIQKLKSGGLALDCEMITFSDNPFQFGNNYNQPYHGANNKPSRMLKLELTDGHRTLQACEYRPIKSLNTDLPAGTKILIKGSVLCRRQVLLLQEENVCVMGGEVEDLVLVSDPLVNLQTEMDKNKQGTMVHDT